MKSASKFYVNKNQIEIACLFKIIFWHCILGTDVPCLLIFIRCVCYNTAEIKAASNTTHTIYAMIKFNMSFYSKQKIRVHLWYIDHIFAISTFIFFRKSFAKIRWLLIHWYKIRVQLNSIPKSHMMHHADNKMYELWKLVHVMWKSPFVSHENRPIPIAHRFIVHGTHFIDRTEHKWIEILAKHTKCMK